MATDDTSSEDSSKSSSAEITDEYYHYVDSCIRIIAAIDEIDKCIHEPKLCMTSTQTGDKWLEKLLDGHPDRFYSAFKMSKLIFIDLLRTLERDHGLQGSQCTTTREVLAITLYILANSGSMRLTREYFQHSIETINRYFSQALKALLLLAIDVVKPVDPQFRDIPTKIRYDVRYMPFFKDCVGVIDGTHVDAKVPIEERIKYIGRYDITTQNVMAACDFNLCFTFFVAGWEGSAHDSRIFGRAVNDKRVLFPHPPQGKYYLVDDDYPLQMGYLKPYPEIRYHLRDFAHGSRLVQGMREHFNKTHSSLRSVIEQVFGVWKKKWSILQNMPHCSFKMQRSIVVATMGLHNYIRRHPSRWDPEFNACDMDDTFIHPEAYMQRTRQINVDWDEEDELDNYVWVVRGADQMSAVRDKIADEIYNTRRYYCQISI